MTTATVADSGHDGSGDSSSLVNVAPRTIAAKDGYPLACALLTPVEKDPDFAVIVGPAVGVRKNFYESYARFLASKGCAVLIFDFRGIGASLNGPITAVKASLSHWGEQDLPAVIEAMVAEFPGKKVGLVGHSISGQLFGTLGNSNAVDAVCTVAAQHAYWWSYPVLQRMGYGLIWFLLVPVVARALSYFPGRRFGMQNLPKGVALEWASWVRSPHYMLDRHGAPARQGCHAFTGAIRAYSFSDDQRAPKRLVERLHREYVHANVEYKHVSPEELGATKIGHVGFFFSRFEDTLWQDSFDWLASQMNLPSCCESTSGA